MMTKKPYREDQNDDKDYENHRSNTYTPTSSMEGDDDDEDSDDYDDEEDQQEHFCDDEDVEEDHHPYHDQYQDQEDQQQQLPNEDENELLLMTSSSFDLEGPIILRYDNSNNNNNNNAANSNNNNATNNDTANIARRRRSRRRRWCYCCGCNRPTKLVLLFVVLLFSLFIMKWTQRTMTHPLATCDGCYCIVDNDDESSTSTCPSPTPPTNYSDTTISILESQQVLNPYKLNCNPYHHRHPNNVCQTTPPQDVFENENDGDDVDPVCGIHYDHPMNNNTTDTSTCKVNTYQLKSYKNKTVAQSKGAIVTHSGVCGVCSTTQDLAAYLKIKDLTTEGIACGKRGLLGFHAGVSCYEALGFTHECSKMWIYNNYNTWKYCGLTCATQTFLNKPFNGPPPKCELNDCLTCDETYSGPIFQKVAGRTRRNSGLRSAIARPCHSFTVLEHEACPK